MRALLRLTGPGFYCRRRILSPRSIFSARPRPSSIIPSAKAPSAQRFSKKLIDETRLPMNEIALASGFGCVRRFNAGIRKLYKRTPTQIRRLARQKEIQAENQYLFRLHYRPPYHWEGILAFLAARVTPGLEVVEHGNYRRAISCNRCDGYFEVSPDPERDALVVKIEFSDPHSLIFIIERIRAMFDLNADWEAIVRSLRTDPLLAGPVKADPGLRVPGCWNGFELATRAVLGQQITVKGANALAGRMIRSFGKPFSAAKGLTHLFPRPDVLADAKLASIGLPGARAETIRALARAVSERRISFEGVVDSDAFLNRLCEIPGIGKWTAQYVAMRALAEPDAFPIGDLGLLRATALSSSRELERRAENWRPWRAYAAMYLWRIGGHRVPRANKSVSHKVDQENVERTGSHQHPSMVG
jgi:AraC family transcriptional regulator of adaptative response / DNA-3-methyladenine glycosylase II